MNKGDLVTHVIVHEARGVVTQTLGDCVTVLWFHNGYKSAITYDNDDCLIRVYEQDILYKDRSYEIPFA